MDAEQKRKRKTLRRLAAVAYERELTKHLMTLHDRFHDWLNERIDAFAINDLIHEFHDGPSRDLYVVYTQLAPEMQVARAIAYGFLTDDEVPDQLRQELSNTIEFFREDSHGQA